MPKRTARSRKRARRRVAKKSWLDKLFTFPKLALYLFVFLSAFTIYQITKPSESVMGVTNPDDFMFVTKDEQQAIIQNASKDSPPTFHQLSVFKDANSNARRADVEDCLDKTVTFTIFNGNITKERTIWGCDEPITIYTKARTVTIGLKAVTGYRFTGLTYTDNYYTNRTLGNGKHSIRVTGYPYLGVYFTIIDFGVHRK